MVPHFFTDIATYRLDRPRGQFSEKDEGIAPQITKCLFSQGLERSGPKCTEMDRNRQKWPKLVKQTTTYRN